MEKLMAFRDLLERLINAHGGSVSGAGYGLGGADISCELDGMLYWIEIRPKGPRLTVVGEDARRAEMELARQQQENQGPQQFFAPFNSNPNR